MAQESLLDRFYTLSATLTGFEEVELQGTGVAPTLLDSLISIVSEPIVAELFDTYTAVAEAAAGDPTLVQQGVRQEILSSPKLGPVARNIIQLWYTGSWIQMPGEWSSQYSPNTVDQCSRPLDQTKVVSAAAYIEGLAWTAIDAHPQAAKQPGFGTWAFPPHAAWPQPNSS